MTGGGCPFSRPPPAHPAVEWGDGAVFAGGWRQPAEAPLCPRFCALGGMMSRVTPADARSILDQLGIAAGAPESADLRALIEYVVELGGTEDEIVSAARRGQLGPLALELTLRPPGASLPLDAY